MVVLEDGYVAVVTNTNVVQYYQKWRDPNIWLTSIVLCRGVYYSVVRLHVFRIVNNTFSDNFELIMQLELQLVILNTLSMKD